VQDESKSSQTLTCGRRVCRYCRITDSQKDFLKPRPLTPDDLRWEFGEAESALGLRSALGTFIDMALAGPPSGGGKSNSVEHQAVQPWRLEATARHQCIRKRLEMLEVSAEQLSVLRAAYGPEDWTRCLEDLQVRLPVRQAFGELVNVVLLTPMALAHAARRQAPARPSDAPDVVHDGWSTDEAGVTYLTGVRCAYRPTITSRPKERTLLHRRRLPTPAHAAARLFAEDPALAGSVRGAAIGAACAPDATRAKAIVREAVVLLREACVAARLQEPQRSRRVRGVLLFPMARRSTVQASRAIEVTDAG